MIFLATTKGSFGHYTVPFSESPKERLDCNYVTR